jgi:ribosomal protein S12 methylthiotransferase accessory factor
MLPSIDETGSSVACSTHADTRLAGPPVREIDLGSDFGRALLVALAERHGDAMRRGARLSNRLFRVGSSLAPGLQFVGGEVDAKRAPAPTSLQGSFSLAGSAELLVDALASCVGEGVERLSQIERSGDVIAECCYGEVAHRIAPAAQCLIESVLEARALPRGTPIPMVRARALASHRELLLPADWCLRRQPPGPITIPGAALSTGCAAGPSFEAAAARALLELVERDAASLWWIGGQRPRPLAENGAAMAEAVRLLGALRQDSRERASWLLDITTDLEIPSVAAVSVDASGSGLSCGLAARLTFEQAARAAILEMCQMELALPIVEAKRRERGEAALNEVDRRHLARAALDAGPCELLQPGGVPRHETGQRAGDAGDELALLRALFTGCGLEPLLVDLTRPEFGIPVVCARAPQLQPMPCDWATARLQRMREATGGGERWTGGVALF